MSRDKEKATVEDHLSLDIRGLHRDGLLHAGNTCNCSWKRHGEVVGRIGIVTQSLSRLRLHYGVETRKETEPKDYSVQITWTPCHLGGNRPWFSCPCCGQRVAKLYLRRIFACRHCLRLNYESQQANKRDRAADHSWKLRSALGCPEGFLTFPAECIPKPKGMHWRTFEQKVEQLKSVDASAWADAGVMFESFERRMEQISRSFGRG